MIHYCPNCGTEVDETAAFCPTCGQPLDEVREAGSAAPSGPAAPPEPVASAAAPAPPTRAHPQEAPPASAPEAGPRTSSLPRVDLPITWPVMLSGWLIGIGALVAIVGLVVIFFSYLNPIDLVLLVLLILIAATVFLSASLPAVPHLRIATMAVGLIGLGVALDRIGFGSAGLGALLAEIGRDSPMATPGRST